MQPSNLQLLPSALLDGHGIIPLT